MVTHRPVGKTLDDDANRGAYGHRPHRHDDRAEDGRVRVHVHGIREVIAGEGAEHVYVAVREVDEPKDPVHHRVSERDERIDGAERETVNELLKEGVH